MENPMLRQIASLNVLGKHIRLFGQYQAKRIITRPLRRGLHLRPAIIKEGPLSITRRKFLKAGTLLALSLGAPLNLVFGQQGNKGGDGNTFDGQDMPADPLAHYTRSAFASYINSIFRLYTGYSTIEVALVEVKDLAPDAAAAANGKECFSLLFRGGTRALRQNTYAMDHPALGKFQLFLVPGAPDDNGAQSFVAIINRLSYKDNALKSAPSRLSKPSTVIKPDKTVVAPPPTNTPAVTTAPPATAPIVTQPTQIPAPTQRPVRKKKRPRKLVSRPFADSNHPSID